MFDGEGTDKRFVFQGVHALHEVREAGYWEEDEDRLNRYVAWQSVSAERAGCVRVRVCVCVCVDVRFPLLASQEG